MQTSALSARLRDELIRFAWDEWSQMGVPGSSRGDSPWAQDPEALLVFTLEIGRDDPRLLDSVLGWWLANEQLLSVRRLRAMCVDDEDTRLLSAALGWLGQFASPERKAREAKPAESLEPLFRGLAMPVSEADPAFAAAGFSRPALVPSSETMPPRTSEPINFAFRLRHLLGVSARAEVARHLLTVDGAFVSTQAVARSAGFARRNVQDALASLEAAGAVEVRSSPGSMHWGTDPARWAPLLRIAAEATPQHRDWPDLLAALRTVLRWLSQPELDSLSSYLLASRTRELLEKTRDRFEHAGVSVRSGPAETAWDDLLAVLEASTSLLSRNRRD